MADKKVKESFSPTLILDKALRFEKQKGGCRNSSHMSTYFLHCHKLRKKVNAQLEGCHP